jgi:hypothetical protein
VDTVLISFMNEKEFEAVRKYLEVDRSAELFGEPLEGGDSRYFGYATRHYEVVGTLNSFEAKGWMAPEGYQPGEVREDSPKLRLIGYNAMRLAASEGITHTMVFEDLNVRISAA